jgi:hypothetical protein
MKGHKQATAVASRRAARVPRQAIARIRNSNIAVSGVRAILPRPTTAPTAADNVSAGVKNDKYKAAIPPATKQA